MEYAQIVILKKLGGFDDELTYGIPDFCNSKCDIGSFVEVPFHNKKAKGIVVKITKNIQSNLDKNKVKEIVNLISDLTISKEYIELARFISTYYQTSMSRAMRLFFPKKIWSGNLSAPVQIFFKVINKDASLRGDKQKRLVDIIRDNGGLIELSRLRRGTEEFSLSTIRSLVKKGIIEEVSKPLFEPFDLGKNIFKEPDIILNSDQADALDQINKSDKPVLLHGVTGSGKTEVYLRKILETIKNGKQVILLVPEIALTPQMINYFKDYLKNHIAVFHSKLTDSGRALEWWKVKLGHCPLIIGSRSAIFAPVSNLGLVILDEEHEWTYKQESTPYYETHRVAEKMSKLWSAHLIFGSATPKAESYKKARAGDYTYLHLPERIHKNDMPHIDVVDLREEFKKRNFSIFSLKLQNKIKDRLSKNEQIILFVNQRGMANAVACRDCGYTEVCPNCDISLKLHNGIDARRSTHLRCHYCDFKKEPEIVCPECNSHYIKHIGVGTQRVEHEMRKLFPNARVIRADSDTTKNNNGFSSIYDDFTHRKFDVLIGTQMIAKGLDFANVSLIGIVLADIGLHIPDFRSSERLFQILTQVSGRCGRRDTPGEVILQTYNPDHRTIQRVANYEYSDFIENELEVRSKLSYPPFNRMIKFTVVGSDLDKLTKHIQFQQETLEDIFKINNLKVKIISAPALLSRRANFYYYNVLLRAEDPNVIFSHWQPPKGWRIDVDPVHTT